MLSRLYLQGEIVLYIRLPVRIETEGKEKKIDTMYHKGDGGVKERGNDKV